MEYRVDELAEACGVSVDTVRYYRSKGLLPPPRRQGRVALYGRDHAARIRRIRALQRKGLPLAVIRRVVSGALRRADADLAEAVAAAQAGGDRDELLTLQQLARRSGMPAVALRAVQRSGLRLGRRVDGKERFTAADVEVVRQGLRLLEAGIPIDALLGLAKRYDAAARAVAEQAVELFDRHVRAPIRERAATEAEAAERLVAAFRELLPAVTSIVAHHFRRVLLAAAEQHIEQAGSTAEIAASRAESRRLREAVWPA